jgi:hypothetical protein
LHAWKKKNEYLILVSKPEWLGHLERPICEDIFKADLKETGYKGVDRRLKAHDRCHM